MSFHLWRVPCKESVHYKYHSCCHSHVIAAILCIKIDACIYLLLFFKVFFLLGALRLSRCVVTGGTEAYVVSQGMLLIPSLGRLTTAKITTISKSSVSQHYSPAELHKFNTGLVYGSHHMCVYCECLSAFSVRCGLVWYFCLCLYIQFCHMST